MDISLILPLYFIIKRIIDNINGNVKNKAASRLLHNLLMFKASFDNRTKTIKYFVQRFLFIRAPCFNGNCTLTGIGIR